MASRIGAHMRLPLLDGGANPTPRSSVGASASAEARLQAPMPGGPRRSLAYRTPLLTSSSSSSAPASELAGRPLSNVGG
eukprot:15432783-Alexandrium_andersonii.AAC.1